MAVFLSPPSASFNPHDPHPTGISVISEQNVESVSRKENREAIWPTQPTKAWLSYFPFGFKPKPGTEGSCKNSSYFVLVAMTKWLHLQNLHLLNSLGVSIFIEPTGCFLAVWGLGVHAWLVYFQHNHIWFLFHFRNQSSKLSPSIWKPIMSLSWSYLPLPSFASLSLWFSSNLVTFFFFFLSLPFLGYPSTCITFGLRQLGGFMSPLID